MLDGMLADERRSGSEASALWRAEATLRRRRREALIDLERVFARGSAPERLDGPLDGRLVAITVGFGVSFLVEAIARLYLPWTGKTFDPVAAEGRNRFVRSARPILRALWPRAVIGPEDGGFAAFGFDTSVGPSATMPGLQVFRIDYAEPEGPWPVRLILDELVDVGDGQLLGQALIRVRGRYRRVAWFALERG